MNDLVPIDFMSIASLQLIDDEDSTSSISPVIAPNCSFAQSVIQCGFEVL